MLNLSKEDFIRRGSVAPAFDAVEEVKAWIGKARYDEVLGHLRKTNSCEDWAAGCAMFLGIEGYCVEAWYEHIFGQGSWVEPLTDEDGFIMILFEL